MNTFTIKLKFMKIKIYQICLLLLVAKYSISQSYMDNCNKAIEMMNKGNIDSLNYFLSNSGYFSNNYVDDRSECFLPFNKAKEKKYLADFEKNPNDVKAAASIAVADYWLKKYDDAAKYYELAITLDPKTNWYYTNLSSLYSTNLNNPAKAEEIDSKFLNLFPTPENYTSVGQNCFASKSYTRAITYFQKSLVGNDNDHIAYNHISSCFLKLGKIDSAIFYSTKSHNLKPQYRANDRAIELLIEAYNYKLDSLKLSGDIQGFVKTCEKIEADFPKTYPKIFDLYDLKWDLRDYYPAVKDLAVNPSSSGYLKLAEYLQKKEDFGSAISALQNAIKLNPKSGEANFQLGYIYMEEKKEYKKALQYFNTAYPNLQPYPQENCLFNIGLCYDKLGDNANAITTFKKCLIKDPTNKNAHYKLYMLYTKIGDKANADIHQRKS